MRDIKEVVAMIRESLLAVSAVVFSGGEPTMQKDALLALAREAKA
jgi:pyruvate formate lyase activating enzyme